MFTGARTVKRKHAGSNEGWRALKWAPSGLVLAAVLLLAGGTLLAHHRLRAATNGGKVKYIHVITPNTSCDGIAAAASQLTSSNSSADAATFPAGSAALLQHLLPLTNFSGLRTGQILDSAAAAGTPVQQLQPLMQLHQHMWCSANYNREPVTNITSVKFSNVSLFVYNSNDIVSNELRGKGHSWEHNEIKEMLWAVRQYWKQAEVMKYIEGSKMQQAQSLVVGVKGASSGRHLQQQQQQQQQQQDMVVQGGGDLSSRQSLTANRPSNPLMVDVGSNVGWFAVNAAAAGARVAAFEAMDSNLALLRRTLCANNWLAQRIALFGTGLGTEAGACSIVSGEDNKGDGIVLCGKDPQTAMKERGWNVTDYKVRGEISIKRLDSLIQEDVQVMKMDVEGFELHVLKGATGLLQRYNVWYIMLECNKGLIGGDKGQLEYFRYLDSIGYSISTYGFSGPFINPEHIKDGSIRTDAWNLYCVRKDLRQAQLAMRAGVTAPKGIKGGL